MAPKDLHVNHSSRLQIHQFVELELVLAVGIVALGAKDASLGSVEVPAELGLDFRRAERIAAEVLRQRSEIVGRRGTGRSSCCRMWRTERPRLAEVAALEEVSTLSIIWAAGICWWVVI